MLLVRCSTKLLKRLRVETESPAPTPDSRLGDWYATVLQMRPHHVVLLVNERTRLAVVMPVREFTAPGPVIAGAIARVLVDMGADAEAVGHERRAMAEITFARPSSRSISETMNELAFHLEQFRESNPNLSEHTLSMKLGQVPVAIPRFGTQRPADVALQVLAR